MKYCLRSVCVVSSLPAGCVATVPFEVLTSETLGRFPFCVVQFFLGAKPGSPPGQYFQNSLSQLEVGPCGNRQL